MPLFTHRARDTREYGMPGRSSRCANASIRTTQAKAAEVWSVQLDKADRVLNRARHPLAQETAPRPALAHLVKGRTIIAITQRLSTPQNFDRKVVLEDGASTQLRSGWALRSLRRTWAPHRHRNTALQTMPLAQSAPSSILTVMPFETMHTLRKVPDASPLIPELSVVAIVRDAVTDDGVTVPAGSRGTVVAVYAAGAAYEVEFARPIVGNMTLPAEALAAA